MNLIEDDDVHRFEASWVPERADEKPLGHEGEPGLFTACAIKSDLVSARAAHGFMQLP
jgi:hypothetical protein